MCCTYGRVNSQIKSRSSGGKRGNFTNVIFERERGLEKFPEAERALLFICLDVGS